MLEVRLPGSHARISGMADHVPMARLHPRNTLEREHLKTLKVRIPESHARVFIGTDNEIEKNLAMKFIARMLYNY